jgi:hypothetical protein
MIPKNCIDNEDEGDGGGNDDDDDEDDRIAKCRTLFTMPNVLCFCMSVVSINNLFSLV